jgi:hypothetical protein
MDEDSLKGTAMKEREQKTTEDGGLHAFRTEIPNTVIRGLKSRDLSVHAKWLYVYFKSVCGDTRECYRTTSTISAESGVSRAMVSTAKRELVRQGLITVTKAKNPNRQPDHVIIKNIWVENFQEFSVLLANTGVLLANADEETQEEEISHEEIVSVLLANAEDEERSISERSVLLANTGVLLANQRRSQEEDPLKKEKESLTTFETSPGAGSEASPPGPPVAVPQKPKRAKVIKPLAPESWTYRLLQEYADSFDVDALNDQDWWKDMAKSLPEFTKEFVSLAFADLANWLRANPRRVPHSRRGWLERMTTSLNFYYDRKFSKRDNGPSAGGAHNPHGFTEKEMTTIQSGMDADQEVKNATRTQANPVYGARRQYPLLSGPREDGIDV